MTDSIQNDAVTHRPRRRPTPAPTLDYSVPSPCIKVCWFADDTPYCQGCWRSMDEIRDWMIMRREQKLAVLDLLAERKQA